MVDTTTDTTADQIREEYSEFTVESGVVGMISDPQNDRAWIASTRTATIQQ